MHPLLDFALTKSPGVYARLTGFRRYPNIEKVAFLNLVQRGDVIIDAGANLGYYTVLFSHLAGRDGRVHAFEPVPSTFAKLSNRIAQRCYFENVLLNPRALTATVGPVTLMVPGSDLGQASLASHTAGSWGMNPAVTVHSSHATTLDAYAAEQELRALDFLKCDVEGAELSVLLGGREAITRFSPLVFVEVCAAWTVDFGYQPTELVSALKAIGYGDFLLVTDRIVRLALPERALSSDQLQGSANLLCAIPGLHDRRLARLNHWLTEVPVALSPGAGPG